MVEWLVSLRGNVSSVKHVACNITRRVRAHAHKAETTS